MNTTLTHHTQACLEAWLSCENLLCAITQKDVPFSARTRQVLDECAHICLGTGHALKKELKHIKDLALLCVGICEECAEVCERYNDALFTNCATACRKCAATITQLVTPAA